MDLPDILENLRRRYPGYSIQQVEVERRVEITRVEHQIAFEQLSGDIEEINELLRNLNERKSGTTGTAHRSTASGSAARAAEARTAHRSTASGSAARAAETANPPINIRWQAVYRTVPSNVPSVDNVQKFREEFYIFISRMHLQGEVPLEMVANTKFCASFSDVRGDGNCGPRAFLTLLALQSTGRLLHSDPPQMKMWIERLKELMIPCITQLTRDRAFRRALLTIPENGVVENVDHYFSLFLSDGYHFTNFEFRVLAIMFDIQINIIRQESYEVEEYQSFVPTGTQVNPIRPDHLNILYQPGHYVPIVEIFECWLSLAPVEEY